MRDDLRRIGIIDIGSNSIRLVIYDTTREGGYKIIKECKYSARLSEKITKENSLEQKDMETIVPVLRQFKEICMLLQWKPFGRVQRQLFVMQLTQAK